MRSIKLFFALLLGGLFSQAAISQCCCSGPIVKVTDGAGFTLPASDVRVTAVPNQRRNPRLSAYESDKDIAVFTFSVSCGDGTESLLIEHLGVEMRVRFKMFGDYGRPHADIVFTPGDHVAEFAKERDDESEKKIVLRTATAEEMKEIEPPATDAPSDQTASSS